MSTIHRILNIKLTHQVSLYRTKKIHQKPSIAQIPYQRWTRAIYRRAVRRKMFSSDVSDKRWMGQQLTELAHREKQEYNPLASTGPNAGAIALLCRLCTSP